VPVAQPEAIDDRKAGMFQPDEVMQQLLWSEAIRDQE